MTGPARNRGLLGAPRARLAALLACSFALRMVLVYRGGENFWPDESRFEGARDAAADIAAAQWKAAATELFAHADHVLFRLAGLPVALIEAWRGSFNPVLEAAYLALFSVGALYLIWAIAKRSGADDDEALWAAFLAAAANSLFFYSRHLLPYDSSLFLMLLALWLGSGRRPVLVSAGVGALVALGFLTYNGYWLLGASVLAIHVAFGGGGIRAALGRAACAALGFLAVAALVIGAGMALSPTLGAEYRTFSASVRQGDFFLGYRVIAGYLWSSERLLAPVWLVAFIRFAAWPPPGASSRSRAWLTGLMVVTAGLIFFSDVVPRFMVYGRLVRQAVPYLCLGAGGGMAAFLRSWRYKQPWMPAAVTALVAALAAWNFAGPIRIVYPDQFLSNARGIMRRESTTGFAFYKLFFAGPLWGQKLDFKPGNYEVLLRRPNPDQFVPYQYEGFSAAQRRDLNAHDVSMRLVSVPLTRGGGDVDWGAYPGPVSITAEFDPLYWGESDPLISTGITGAGDIVLVTYNDPDHVSFGLDRWGVGLTQSAPVKVDYAKSHQISILDGALLPPPGSAVYKARPDLLALRSQFIVSLDGRPVIAAHARFSEASPSQISLGANAIGASSAEPAFTGNVLGLYQASVASITEGTPVLAGPRIASRRPKDWDGAIGPLRVAFTLPKPANPEPLLSLTGGGTKDVVFVRKDADGMLRAGIDRVGAGALTSEPIAEASGSANVLDVCLGSLLPGPTAGIYASVPGLLPLRGKAYLRLNGVTAIFERMPFGEASPTQIAFGANTVGSSTYGENFGGSFLSVSAIGPDDLPMLGSRLASLLVNPDPRWEGYTGSLNLTLALPQDTAGSRQPLLATGTRGADDVIYVEYLGASQVRFGYEHTPYPPMVSKPVSLPAGRCLQLLLSMGSLFPPANAPLFAEEPDLDSLRTFVHVGVNGTPVLHAYAEFAPSDPSSSEVGRNSVANSLVEASFSGLISGVSRAPTRAVFQDGHVPASLGRPGWGGYPGALDLKLRFEAGPKGALEPLLTTGLRGIGDVVFLEFLGNGLARIGQDHWGSKLLLSSPFALGSGPEHGVEVSLGSLYPADGQPGASDASTANLRNRTIVIVDGRRVLDAEEASHPTRPEWIMAGMNLIGASTAPSLLSGQVLSVADAPLATLAGAEGLPALTR